MKNLLAYFLPFLLIGQLVEAQARPNPYLAEKSVFAGPFPAEVTRIVDADTIEVSIEVWPRTTQIAFIRLRGVDAPEIRTTCDAEKALGNRAKEWVEARIEIGSIVELRNIAPDSFSGRYIGDLFRWRSDRWLSLADELREQGYARDWEPDQISIPWCLIAGEMFEAEN